jgi:hypothetical protein
VDASTIAGLIVVVGVVGFVVINFTKARRMNLAGMLVFATKANATELRLEVGKPITLVTPIGISTVFGPALKTVDFETWILGRLNAFQRQELGAAGRFEWQFEENGIGKIEAHIEPNKARLVLPRPVK